jgi:hypothetical protein
LEVSANASKLSHAELDEAEEVDEGGPIEFGDDHRELLELLWGMLWYRSSTCAANSVCMRDCVPGKEDSSIILIASEHIIYYCILS